MRIFTKICNWFSKHLDSAAVSCRQDASFREDVAEISHQLADSFCMKHRVVVNSRFELAHTPMLFRVELALTLSSRYGVEITVQNIFDAKDVDELASTIMRKQYQCYRVVDPTLLASGCIKSSNIIA